MLTVYFLSYGANCCFFLFLFLTTLIGVFSRTLLSWLGNLGKRKHRKGEEIAYLSSSQPGNGVTGPATDFPASEATDTATFGYVAGEREPGARTFLWPSFQTAANDSGQQPPTGLWFDYYIRKPRRNFPADGSAEQCRRPYTVHSTMYGANGEIDSGAACRGRGSRRHPTRSACQSILYVPAVATALSGLWRPQPSRKGQSEPASPLDVFARGKVFFPMSSPRRSSPSILFGYLRTPWETTHDSLVQHTRTPIRHGHQSISYRVN